MELIANEGQLLAECKAARKKRFFISTVMGSLKSQKYQKIIKIYYHSRADKVVIHSIGRSLFLWSKTANI
jgi:hypothetical protein